MSILLNVSQKLDRQSVELLLADDTSTRVLGISYCVVGTFGRDVVLRLCVGIDTGEATLDIDLGLMLDDWAKFNALRNRLLDQGGFVEHRNIPHRLGFRGARLLDIVPFGAIER